MEKPIKMDDLGGKPTIFGNTHMIFFRWVGSITNVGEFFMDCRQDGDVVVVTANPDEQGPPPLSTHQAHYVPHPLQARPRKNAWQKLTRWWFLNHFFGISP